MVDSWFYEIWLAIYNKLVELKTASVIWEVYNRDIKIEWWISVPAIIITPTDWQEVLLDSCLDNSTFNFSIRLIDQIYTGIGATEDNIRKLADSVLEKLKDLWDIVYTNWATYKVEYSYIRGYTDTQEPFRVFQVSAKFSATEQK